MPRKPSLTITKKRFNLLAPGDKLWLKGCYGNIPAEVDDVYPGNIVISTQENTYSVDEDGCPLENFILREA
jgi:hypothetical protein